MLRVAGLRTSPVPNLHVRAFACMHPICMLHVSVRRFAARRRLIMQRTASRAKNRRQFLVAEDPPRRAGVGRLPVVPAVSLASCV